MLRAEHSRRIEVFIGCGLTFVQRHGPLVFESQFGFADSKGGVYRLIHNGSDIRNLFSVGPGSGRDLGRRKK